MCRKDSTASFTRTPSRISGTGSTANRRMRVRAHEFEPVMGWSHRRVEATAIDALLRPARTADRCGSARAVPDPNNRGATASSLRNFWKAYVDPQVTAAGEAAVAKIASLVVKVGALLVIVYLPTQFALDLQLLGGLWILQTLPALIFGLFTRWFTAPALLAGWAVGLFGGTYLAWTDGLKPLHALTFGDTTVTAYVGLIAFAANVTATVLVNLGVGRAR